MTPKLYVLGEALMDCVAQSDGNLRPLLGGSPFNLACAAALQGVDVGHLNPYSTDAFGRALQARLEQCGARALSQPSPKPTSLAIVRLMEGVPSYSFYREGVADRDWLAAEFDSLLHATQPGVLHTGSLMAIPPEHEKVMQVIQHARRLGWIISVDVNVRPRLAADPDAYRRAVFNMAAQAHWLRASDEDLEWLGFPRPNLEDAEALSRQWINQGIERVALTFGVQGASLAIGQTFTQAAAPKIQLVDTVGAGDTFWGACLADWMEHGKHTTQASARLPTTLHRALQAAALNCERSGCQPPTRAELEAALDS